MGGDEIQSGTTVNGSSHSRARVNARPVPLAGLGQAVRDQTRIVDLKQVNRVLIRSHWRNDHDHPIGSWWPSARTRPSRWTREQIRAARLVPIIPLLQRRGLQLIQRETGNHALPAYPGLILKDSYWRWPQRNLAGNTITSSPRFWE